MAKPLYSIKSWKDCYNLGREKKEIAVRQFFFFRSSSKLTAAIKITTPFKTDIRNPHNVWYYYTHRRMCLRFQTQSKIPSRFLMMSAVLGPRRKVDLVQNIKHITAARQHIEGIVIALNTTVMLYGMDWRDWADDEKAIKDKFPLKWRPWTGVNLERKPWSLLQNSCKLIHAHSNYQYSNLSAYSWWK